MLVFRALLLLLLLCFVYHCEGAAEGGGTFDSNSQRMSSSCLLLLILTVQSMLLDAIDDAMIGRGDNVGAFYVLSRWYLLVALKNYTWKQ